jgi:hypothetical protein
MKSKNVIILLLSLTLSLVLNAKPMVDHDIGLSVRSSPEAVIYPGLASIVYVTIVLEPLSLIEPIFVRTNVVNATVNVIEIPADIPIISKCRDVDLQGTVKSYHKNITATARPRSRTAYLHYDGGGGHGSPA